MNATTDTSTPPIQLTVVAYQEGATARWILQVLEHDFAASGASMGEALAALDYMVTAFVARAMETGRPLFRGLGRAPERFQQLFRQAQETGAVMPIKRPLLPIYQARTQRHAENDSLTLAFAPKLQQAA